MGKIRVYREDQADRVVQEAAAVLAGGGLVACPTETFYALAADVSNPAALTRVLALKGRPATKPLLVLVAAPAMLPQVVASVPEAARRLMAQFWPGPLTLILPARPGLPLPLTGGTGTVGVRQPGLALTREVAARLHRPITGTSANRAGEAPLTTAQQVEEVFGPAVDLILEAGPCPGGLPSTIVDLTVAPPRLRRAGVLPPAALRPYLPDLVLAADVPGG